MAEHHEILNQIGLSVNGTSTRVYKTRWGVGQPTNNIDKTFSMPTQYTLDPNGIINANPAVNTQYVIGVPRLITQSALSVAHYESYLNNGDETRLPVFSILLTDEDTLNPHGAELLLPNQENHKIYRTRTDASEPIRMGITNNNEAIFGHDLLYDRDIRGDVNNG